MISVHLWNFLYAFIPKCFMQNPKKSFSPNAPSVVDLESPCRFIWRPGDRISAAPAILNMRPCRCVNVVTVWGKVKDTTAKITIMQNQFPCMNQQIHWSYYGHDHGRFFFRIHQSLWFCYVFLASLTLNLPAQNCSPHHAPNMCVHVIKGNLNVIYYLIFLLWHFFYSYRKMFSWYQTFKYILITMWRTCMVWFFALVVFSNNYISTYKPLWYT